MEYGKKLIIMENEKHTLEDLKNDEITETCKMGNAHCRTWNMGRKLKITENENNTL
jgi:hypothetical protein